MVRAGHFVLAAALVVAASASASQLRGSSSANQPALPAGDTPNLSDDGTYKYYDSSREVKSTFFVPPSLRWRWKNIRMTRWDVGRPLPQDAPPGTVMQTPDGVPSDFWPTPLNPPAYTTEDARGGSFVG